MFLFPTEFESADKQCIQDIPIRPVPRVEWSDIAEPTYEVDDHNFVSFVIPDLKRFKHLTDRYKNLDTYVRFEVFHNGEMGMQLLSGNNLRNAMLSLSELLISKPFWFDHISDRVTLSTHFKNLEVIKNQGAVIEEDAEPVVVNVELKKLALFLGADTFGSKRVMASFVNEKLLHLDFINDNIAMNLYLPAVQI